MSAASTADAIDLTGDRHEHSIQPRLAVPDAPDAATTAAGTSATSSRAQRLPRFQRDIIDLAGSDEEGQQQDQTAQGTAHGQRMNTNLPMPFGEDPFMPQMEADEDSLFIPLTQTRPTTAGLRRPGYPRRPTPAMDFDDVEIVSSRPLSRNPSRRATPAVFMPGQTATQSPANNASATIDLTADDDDDVIHTDTRPLPSINGDRPAMAGSGIGTRDRPGGGGGGGDFGIGRLVQRFRTGGQDQLAANFLQRYTNHENNEDVVARTHMAQRMARRRADQARTHRQDVEERTRRVQLHRAQLQDLTGQHARRIQHAVAAAGPNVMMDYGMVGFDMGLGVVVEPPAQKYEPPKAAEKGFTRSPGEDEEVVCPNCGDELAVGKDEMKQQIWVVKSCGHVSGSHCAQFICATSRLTCLQAYCGECATRIRPTSSSKKGKGRAPDPALPPPLKKCVVVGCEKSATKKDMIHVYMSS